MGDSWIRDYLSLNKDTEVPEIFAMWCGLAGISISLQRNVYIPMGQYTIYPNQYIILVASSGRCRKSTAVGVVESLLRKADAFNLLSQKLTPEALIQSLRKEEETEENKVLAKKTAEGTVIVDELATFLNKSSYDMGLGSLLTPLWDCKDVFEYRTKGGGIERLDDCSLSLLGASTVDWLRRAIPQDSIGGGLTSRMIFVYGNRPANPVARTFYSEEKEKISAFLVEKLQEYSTLKGQVKLTDEAWDDFTDIYNEFYENSPFYDDPVLSGYASRRHVHLLKIALALMVADYSRKELVIEPRHLEGAHIWLKKTEGSIGKVMNLVLSTDTGANSNYILAKIAQAGKEGISRSDLIRKVSFKFSSNDLTEIINTLKASDQIREVVNGRRSIYMLFK